MDTEINKVYFTRTVMPLAFLLQIIISVNFSIEMLLNHNNSVSHGGSESERPERT
jgi:hypothetical protein